MPVSPKYKSMIPTPRSVEYVAPETWRKASVTRFRKVVKSIDNKVHRRQLDGKVSLIDGALAYLSDDEIVYIFRILMKLPSREIGLKYFESVRCSSKSVVSLALTCRRFAAVLQAACPDVQAEALARSCTRVVPRAPYNDVAFTRQMRDELLSCDHIKLLRAAQNAMACHCAAACCHNIQRAFNSDIKKGSVFSRPASPTLGMCASDESTLVQVSENCALMVVSNCGNHAFVYSRKRCSPDHAEARGRRFLDVLQHKTLSKRVQARSEMNDTSPARARKATPCFETPHSLDIYNSDMSEPLQMRISQDGESVVFTRAVHTVSLEATEPFSSAWVWNVEWDGAVELTRPRVSSNVDESCLSAQDAWFRDTEDGNQLLVVAWSTDFVHVTGHATGSNAPPQTSPHYCFTTYLVDTTLKNVEMYETMFDLSIMQGTLLLCSPTADGNSVVTLVKRRDIIGGCKMVTKHCLDSSTSHHIKAAHTNGPKGPVSAAVSPNGDCVVVLCKHHDSMRANFCWHASYENYSTIQSVDVSSWMGRRPSDGPDELSSDLVKAVVTMQFSPCGRFVALVDCHPRFGAKPNNHGVVIIDAVMRDQASRFRPYPLAATEDQAPRSFHWTRQGIWLMAPGTNMNGSIGPRGGALCLHAPVGNSFA